jgi:hypothetical protein
VAPQVGAITDGIDPFLVSGKAGVLGIVNLPLIAVVGNPYLLAPLNKRDGRDSVFRFPIWVYFPFLLPGSWYVLTGLNHDNGQLALGTSVSLFDTIRVGAQIGWPRVLGDNHTFKDAAGSLYGQLRF